MRLPLQFFGILLALDLDFLTTIQLENYGLNTVPSTEETKLNNISVSLPSLGRGSRINRRGQQALIIRLNGTEVPWKRNRRPSKKQHNGPRKEG